MAELIVNARDDEKGQAWAKLVAKWNEKIEEAMIHKDEEIQLILPDSYLEKFGNFNYIFLKLIEAGYLIMEVLPGTNSWWDEEKDCYMEELVNYIRIKTDFNKEGEE